MKLEITLYIADLKINNLMKFVDLKPDYKWYIRGVSAEIDVDDISMEKLTKVMTEQMKASRENDDFYVPAIQCGDILIKDDGVKELSDGDTSMFIGAEDECTE